MRDHAVNVVASLPCYSAKNVNMQRGKGVFDRSIMALRKFNSLGYADETSGLKLDLVYNPIGNYYLVYFQSLSLTELICIKAIHQKLILREKYEILWLNFNLRQVEDKRKIQSYQALKVELLGNVFSLD